MWRLWFLCLLGLAGGPLVVAGAPLLIAGCTFTAYEKELVVAPPTTDEAPLSTLATASGEESWMQFIDFNHIVDSIVEIFKHTAAKEAIRNGVHYTERKRFLHIEFGESQSGESLRDSLGDSHGGRRTNDSP